MCTASRQPPSALRSIPTASSWSRAVSGSIVNVSQPRKSVRPAASSGPGSRATRVASASTSSGNAVGSSYFATITFRSTPRSSIRPSTSITRPTGLRVAEGGRVTSIVTIVPDSAPADSPAGTNTSCSTRLSKGTTCPPNFPSSS